MVGGGGQRGEGRKGGGGIGFRVGGERGSGRFGVREIGRRGIWGGCEGMYGCLGGGILKPPPEKIWSIK